MHLPHLKGWFGCAAMHSAHGSAAAARRSASSSSIQARIARSRTASDAQLMAEWQHQ